MMNEQKRSEKCGEETSWVIRGRIGRPPWITDQDKSELAKFAHQVTKWANSKPGTRHRGENSPEDMVLFAMHAVITLEPCCTNRLELTPPRDQKKSFKKLVAVLESLPTDVQERLVRYFPTHWQALHEECGVPVEAISTDIIDQLISSAQAASSSVESSIHSTPLANELAAQFNTPLYLTPEKSVRLNGSLPITETTTGLAGLIISEVLDRHGRQDDIGGILRLAKKRLAMLSEHRKEV